jgi:hypothetical protein
MHGIYDTSGYLLIGYDTALKVGDPSAPGGAEIFSGTSPAALIISGTNDVSITSLDVSTLYINGTLVDSSTLTDGVSKTYVDTSLGARDVSITSNLNRIIVLDASIGVNVSQLPFADASYNNGDYYYSVSDASMYFKANDVWIWWDASTLF